MTNYKRAKCAECGRYRCQHLIENRPSTAATRATAVRTTLGKSDFGKNYSSILSSQIQLEHQSMHQDINRPATSVSNLAYKLSRPKSGGISFVKMRQQKVERRPLTNISGREWVSPYMQAKHPLEHAQTLTNFLPRGGSLHKKAERPKTTQPGASSSVFVPIEEAAQYLESIHQQVTD